MSDEKEIYFRVDANQHIASGHVMRCLSIADAMHIIKVKCTFICADMESGELIKDKGYEVIFLNSKWNHLGGEIDRMVSVIRERKISMLFIDSYYVTQTYLEALHREAKLIYMDDLHAFDYPVDMLINYAVYAEDFNYVVNRQGPRLLLGCDFVPLRGQFQNIEKKNISKEVKSIMITTGGTDQYDFAGSLLKVLCKDDRFRKLHFTIIAGKFCKQIGEWSAYAENRSNVQILSNVTNMATVMQKMDIAISAGGSTLYELCACGVPTISYSFADNQLDNVHKFDKLEMIKYIGDLRDDFENCIEQCCLALENSIHHVQERKRISDEMQQKVDGCGSMRIAQVIQQEMLGAR